MISWYLYTVFDGVTWGILLVLFVVCIWGEFNPNASSDKYYAIGVLPYFISEFLSLIFSNYISVDYFTLRALFVHCLFPVYSCFALALCSRDFA